METMSDYESLCLSLVTFLNAIFQNQILNVDPGFNLKNIFKKQLLLQWENDYYGLLD